ncbi:kinetochore protein fta4 [Ophiocordyceps camponoti-floridani]|uniref:Kinetochore protein fta4 n=1 Tax=Ophiocordyceps camponoti-floridani TaxID=2030778 RepID=A0A8H4VFQ3_9HYPO|nr:kinetochore protein fta4 [Ophiocordyceps camponoti-floridani]
MAPAPPPTVPSLKLNFLSTQISILSRPPAPSSSWRAANDAADQPLSNRAVDDALQALGQAVQRHCRRVYAPQASRHVAEQISNVYAREVERRVAAQAEAAGGVSVGKGLELGDDEAIDSLPPTWPDEKQVRNHPLEAERYAQGVARLVELKEQRRELRERIEKLRRLQEIMAPLETQDGGAGVQENLVTRNGPVEVELERMRLLLARVAGRVGELPVSGGLDGSVDVAGLEGRRESAVDDFLADFP